MRQGALDKWLMIPGKGGKRAVGGASFPPGRVHFVKAITKVDTAECTIVSVGLPGSSCSGKPCEANQTDLQEPALRGV
jgi:hypothetical protein